MITNSNILSLSHQNDLLNYVNNSIDLNPDKGVSESVNDYIELHDLELSNSGISDIVFEIIQTRL